jgi:hypothetical protein
VQLLAAAVPDHIKVQVEVELYSHAIITTATAAAAAAAPAALSLGHGAAKACPLVLLRLLVCWEWKVGSACPARLGQAPPPLRRQPLEAIGSAVGTGAAAGGPSPS